MSSCAWNNYFFSYFKPIFSTNMINSFPMECHKPCAAHPHSPDTHMPGKIKEDKTQTQNTYFSMKNKLLISEGKCILHFSNRFLHGNQEGIEKKL